MAYSPAHSPAHRSRAGSTDNSVIGRSGSGVALSSADSTASSGSPRYGSPTHDDASLLLLQKMLGSSLPSAGDLSGEEPPPPTRDAYPELDDNNMCGYVERRHTWSDWKRVYVVLRAGVLLEFRSERSKDPRKRYDLSDYRVEDGEHFTGEHSFVLRKSKQDQKKKSKDIYFRAGKDTRRWMECVLQFTKLQESEQMKEDGVEKSTISHAEYVKGFEEAAVIADSVGLMTAVNPQFEALSGWTREELVGHNVTIFIPPATAARHDSFLRNYIKTGRKRLIGKPRVLQMIRKCGAEVSVELCLAEVPPRANSSGGLSKEFQAELRMPATQLDPHSIQNTVDTLVFSALQSASNQLRASFTSQVQELLLLQQETLQARTAREAVRRTPEEDEETDRSDYGDFSEGSVEGGELGHKEIEVMRLLYKSESGNEVYSARVDGWGCVMKAIEVRPENHEQVKQLCKEVSVLECLPRHRNLVRYLCHRVSHQRLEIFVTQFESTLREVLAKRRRQNARFDLKTVVQLLLNVASGLVALHERRIMHRDLTSSNIFVTFGHAGDIEYLAIGDFDSAKQLVEEESTARHTMRGTKGHMAPEVLLNHKYGLSADIYTFGMLIYEMVTLRAAFESERSQLIVAQRVTAGKLPHIPSELITSEQWRELEKLYTKCTHLKAAKRPDAPKLKASLLAILTSLY